MLLTPFIEKFYIYYQALASTYSFNQLLTLFFLFSMMGWVLETAYRSFTNGHLINPGFLKGPIVPIYGSAGIFITITIIFTQEETILVRMLIYFTAITAMEFVTGEIMLRLFKQRYWDYTNNPLNVRGHVCLPFSVAWTVLSLLFEVSIHPLSMYLIRFIDDQYLMFLNGAGILILQIDFIHTIWFRQPGQIRERLGEITGWLGTISPTLLIHQLSILTPQLKRRLDVANRNRRNLISFRKRK